MGTKRTEQVEALHRHFLSRVKSGHALTIDGVCAENPEFAEELRELHAERVEDLMVDFLSQHSLADAEAFKAFCSNAAPYEEELRQLPQRMQALGAALRPSATEAESQADRTTQTRFDRFQVLSSRGRGAMGEVFRVWDGELCRELALKVMHPTESMTPEQAERARARFIEEAQVTAQLDHPGIVPVHQIGTTEQGKLFFTMKLVKGRSLESVMDSRAKGEAGWTTMRSLRVILKVSEALAYAHYKGVLHRDLKPANIMVGRYGSAYVMDWGLSRVAGDLDTHIEHVGGGGATRAVASIRSRPLDKEPPHALDTEPGGHVGTPYYMAPEQADGRVTDLTPAADVYGLGATLYHMIAGIPPYHDTHRTSPLPALLLHLRQNAPTPLGQLEPSVPVALVQLVERAMARDPRERFPNMGGMTNALRAILDGSGSSAPRSASNRHGVQEGWSSFTMRNWPALVLLVGGAFVLGLWTRQLLN